MQSPTGRGGAVGLTENVQVSGEFHSGMSSGAVGCEFNVNKSRMHIKQGVFKQIHTSKNAY